MSLHATVITWSQATFPLHTPIPTAFHTSLWSHGAVAETAASTQPPGSVPANTPCGQALLLDCLVDAGLHGRAMAQATAHTTRRRTRSAAHSDLASCSWVGRLPHYLRTRGSMLLQWLPTTDLHHTQEGHAARDGSRQQACTMHRQEAQPPCSTTPAPLPLRPLHSVCCKLPRGWLP
jgi:hypothetical protein